MQAIRITTLLLLAAPVMAQKPDSRPARKMASKPAPASAKGSPAALALARRVVAFAGGAEALGKIDNLVLTAAYGDLERRVFWDRRAKKVRAESIQSAIGRRGPVGYSVMVHDLAIDKLLIRTPPKPKHAPYQGGGKRIWKSDSSLLLAPLKVLDAGVVLAIDKPEPTDSKIVKRLRMHFDGSAGNRSRMIYVFHVEADTGRVLRWDTYRNPRSKRATSHTFEGYRRIGPFRLSLVRKQILAARSSRAPRNVVFSEVGVNVPLPKECWTDNTRVLPLKLPAKAKSRPTSRPR